MTVETGKRSIGGKFGRLLQLCSFAFAICLATQIAKASVVVNFDDIPDTVTFTGDPRATGTCGIIVTPVGDPFHGATDIEQCIVTVAAPAGMTTTIAPGSLTIGEGTTAQNELLLSDFIFWSADPTGQLVTITFESDAAASSNDLIPQCPGGGKCTIDESGLNGQAAFTIHWSNTSGGTTADDVTFGSDILVPEPSSVILMGSMLLGIAGIARKRFRQN